MTQSIELVLDAEAEAAVHAEWVRLAEAGLPSALRTPAPPHHRPHITLWAGESVPLGAEQAWADLVVGLDLRVVLGSWLIFGPRHGRCILVRPVLARMDLLTLQQAVAEAAETDPGGFFGPSRWSPHVTVAPRLDLDHVGPALSVLESSTGTVDARIRGCRRWDGVRRTAWWLTETDGSP